MAGMTVRCVIISNRKAWVAYGFNIMHAVCPRMVWLWLLKSNFVSKGSCLLKRLLSVLRMNIHIPHWSVLVTDSQEEL